MLEMVCRFTSQFKDEYKIPRGSVIDLSRDRGYVLRTTSKILSQCLIYMVDIFDFLQLVEVIASHGTCNFYFLKKLLGFLVDGKEVGSIESKLLCKSILDLYIGEDPFDKKAKEDVKSSLASLLQD